MMTTTIARLSDTSQAFSPEQVLGYTAARPSQNIVHQVVASPFVDATTNGVGLRTGNMSVLLLTEGAKTAAVQILTAPDTFQLSSSDLASIAMTFVLAGGGSVSETFDVDLRTWTVAFDFQEVPSA